MKKVVTSPIFHFIILGSLAYLLYNQFKPDERDEIVVTPQIIESLVRQQEEIQLQPVSEEQREEIIQGYIDDEVLVKEAFKRGLTSTDGRVRKRILSLMRSSFVEQFPSPSYSQLQEFYESRKDYYRSDTSWSFYQVFFAFNSEKLPEGQSFLKQLSESENPLSMGEFNMIGNRLPKMSFERISSMFGKLFATQVIGLPLQQWMGPFQSIQGVHYVFVESIHQPELSPLEEIQDYVRQDYEFEKMREQQQKRIRELREDYEIVIGDDTNE